MAEQEQIQAQVQQTAARQKTGEDVSLKYRGLSYELALELNYYESKYFTWDLPVPFGEKLKLYPVSIKDYDDFMDAVSCFLLDKKKFEPKTPPQEMKKQLKMTDLEFMLSKLSDERWAQRFATLVKLVFHVETGLKCPHCGHVMNGSEIAEAVRKLLADYASGISESDATELTSTNADLTAQEGDDSTGAKEESPNKNAPPVLTCSQCHGDGLYETVRHSLNEETQKLELFVDQQKIDFDEFNRLKNIVLFQNLPDYRDTSYVDPTLKKDYEEQRRIKGQKTENLQASLERRLAAMRVFYGLSDYEGLYKLTVRRFLIEFNMIDDLINYEIGMMGRVCGLTGGPKELKHWIFEEIKDVYADAGYVSQDTMMERVKNVT